MGTYHCRKMACCCGTIETGKVGLKLVMGAYQEPPVQPGCYCIAAPCVTMHEQSIQLLQADCTSECKTKDNVTVTVRTAVQYRICMENIETAVFKVAAPIAMISAQIDDVLRSAIPDMNLDEAYSAKDKMVQQILDELRAAMFPHGYEIVKVLITDLAPEASVVRAMNEINASVRQREAMLNKAEAEKVLAVKQAEADAESKYLSGVGMARMREAITGGFKNSVKEMQECGLEPAQAIHMMLVTQYLDTLKDFAVSGKSSIMVPTGPGALGDIESQVRNGFTQAQALNAGGTGAPPPPPR